MEDEGSPTPSAASEHAAKARIADALRMAEEEGLELVRSSQSNSGFKGVCRYQGSSVSQQGRYLARRSGKDIGWYQTAEEGALAYARWRQQNPDSQASHKAREASHGASHAGPNGASGHAATSCWPSRS